MRIIADVHEPKEIIQYIERDGIPIEVKNITPGDYVIGNVGIERKSIRDFIQSIFKKRIFDQLRRLCESYVRTILILEGDVSELYYIKDNKPYLGAILSIIIDFNTSIIYTKDIVDTAFVLKQLWRRLIREKKGTTIVRYKPPYMDEDDRKIFILEGFPDIGPKLAGRLLNRFKTLRNIFNAKIYQLAGVEGIGEKRAEEIYKIINTPYKKEDTATSL